MNSISRNFLRQQLKNFSLKKIQINLKYSTFTMKNLFLIKDQSKIETKFDNDYFEIKFNLKGRNMQKNLPYIWLRQNCICPKCYNKKTQEIELNLQEIPIDVKPSKIESLNEKNIFKVTWQDEHVSEYDLLNIANFAFEHQLYDINSESKHILWNQKSLKLRNGFDKIKYENFMKDNEFVKFALRSILKYGAVIINKVPSLQSETVKVTERIAKVQHSIFGADCVVTNQFGFVDRAYTSLKLKSHTDNTYLKDAAGLEVFHVINKADEGGDSIFTDGFQCAEKLKKISPESFHTLSTTKVQSQFFKRDEFDLKYTDSIIKLNPLNENLMQIRYNAYDKLNVNHLNINQMIDFYKSLKIFVSLLEDQDNLYKVGLQPDEVIIFDNFRLLHGRTEFKGNRKLITTYISRDDWLSKASILKAI